MQKHWFWGDLKKKTNLITNQSNNQLIIKIVASFSPTIKSVNSHHMAWLWVLLNTTTDPDWFVIFLTKRTGAVQKLHPLSYNVQRERKRVQRWSEREGFHLKWKSNLQRGDERLKHPGIPYHRLWPFQPTSVQRRTSQLQQRGLLEQFRRTLTEEMTLDQTLNVQMKSSSLWEHCRLCAWYYLLMVI